MVAVDQDAAIGQGVAHAMTENQCGLPEAQRHQHRLVRHQPECQDHPDIRRCLQFAGKIRVAGLDLRRLGLVRRRQALHRIGDAAIAQAQIVVGCERYRMRAETEGMQGFVKQDTGIVAGEWTPVRLAPCMPGARPTISRRARGSPKAGTGRAW
jgi:hypothetical protein